MPPLEYPYSEPTKTRNWSGIIMGILGIIILLGIIAYFVLNPLLSIFNKTNDLYNGTQNNNQGIAVGEPNPNGYDCSADVYNCGNFTTQSEAQYVFDLCSNQGKGDIHQLDADGNGEACEGLS